MEAKKKSGRPKKPLYKTELRFFRLRGNWLRSCRRLRSRLRVGLRSCGRRCRSLCGRGRSCRGCRLWRGLRNTIKDRIALPNGLIRAQHHGKGAEHEHDSAPRGGFGENVGSAARTESGLAASTAERASK